MRNIVLVFVFAALAACDPYGICFKPGEPCQIPAEPGWTKTWVCGESTGTCTVPCTKHQDCPPNTEGNAVPRCDNSEHQCVLGCRPGWTCPQGQECVQNDLPHGILGKVRKHAPRGHE